jgi:hypothetical protein
MVWSFHEYNQLSSYLNNFTSMRLNLFQPSFSFTKLDYEDTGDISTSRVLFRLSEPMAGVVVFPVEILNPSIYLPNGVCVDLTKESVPVANLVASGLGYGVEGIVVGHDIDKCHKLRISVGGTTLAEGRMQFNLNRLNNERIRMSAGLFMEGDTLRVYAHIGYSSATDNSIGYGRVESEPRIDRFPLPFLYPENSPGQTCVFGTGISIYSDCPGGDPQGIIDLFMQPLAFEGLDLDNRSGSASDCYAHPFPLEETMDLAPSELSITERESQSLAWGRHPAAVASTVIGWRLSDLETDGHPEWGLTSPAVFAGASRLFRNGREAALVPASNHRSNVSAFESENVRLKTLRIQWTWEAQWPTEVPLTTGLRDIGLLFGGWNEYRMESWAPQSGATLDGREINAVFIAAAITRLDATNLGSAVDQSDAVEITRYALRWFAAYRYRYSASSGWDNAERWEHREESVILSAADGGRLLAGEIVTLSGEAYLEGTYPTPYLTGLGGTLTIQAVGS